MDNVLIAMAPVPWPLALQVADILRGKNKPVYTRNSTPGTLSFS